MFTTRIMCCRKSKGVSTILGTLIFIGILFTSVIPMMLVMKQADTIYTKKVHEMEARDDEGAREKVTASAYPNTSNSSQIMAKVENKGNVPVKIIRVWTNDEYHSQNELIPSNSKKVLGPFTVSVENNSSLVAKVVTERGNVFHSISGSLYYSDGSWFTASLGICVVIYNAEGGMFLIKLINCTEPEPYWEKIIYESHCQEWEDVVASTGVDDPGSYQIVVKEKKGNKWKDLAGTPVDVTISWPDGPPFIMVWISSK